MMNYILTAETADARRVSCGLKAADAVRVSIQVSCDLEYDTLVYAACRLIAKSAAFQGELVPLSYALRFVKSKNRSFCRWLNVRPRYFLMKDCTAKIRVRIDRDGVTVEEVCLLPQSSAPLHDCG